MEERARRRFRATVHYDGGSFYGWQVQPSVRTVQGEVEASLSRLVDEELRVESAGRTDRGVHAVAQEVAFRAPDGWPAAEMLRALNAVLPEDVWIEKLSETHGEFHPRFDATGRRYAYVLGVRDDAVSPLRRGRLWQLGQRPDAELLEESTSLLPGERSFAAFAKAGQPERGTRCRVEQAGWTDNPAGDLVFQVVADRFLHHMVRYLVATLVDVGVGRREPAEFRRLLEEEGDPRPPEPAPAAGLYLTGVRYPDGWNRSGGIPGLLPEPSAERAAP